mmetsp:Transcript_115410/g.313279  ORF Transcript_115410/g.313279 Transcript_115410/m.313279 type:complete len:203 (-) Transcript_115410:296-904(-)
MLHPALKLWLAEARLRVPPLGRDEASARPATIAAPVAGGVGLAVPLVADPVDANVGKTLCKGFWVLHEGVELGVDEPQRLEALVESRIVDEAKHASHCWRTCACAASAAAPPVVAEGNTEMREGRDVGIPPASCVIRRCWRHGRRCDLLAQGQILRGSLVLIARLGMLPAEAATAVCPRAGGIGAAHGAVHVVGGPLGAANR